MISVGVIFGGQSVEHEVSIISGNQALHALNKDKYNVVPIYLTKDNKFYTGEKLFDIKNYVDIPKLLSECEEVLPYKGNKNVVLKRAKGKIFSNNIIQEIDVFMPVVHGTNVEDGTLQGYLEILGAPYTGCDVTASALGMDKFAMKTVLKEYGVNVLEAECVYSKEYRTNSDQVIKRIEEKIGYPVIIKPVNLGSSVGIKKANNRDELNDALGEATSFSQKILAERAIEKLREINCAVLGDYESTKTATLEEPIMGDEILSYKDKYLGGGKGSKETGSKGMSGASRKMPAEVSKEQEEKIKEMAQKAFYAINANGVSRVDLMIDEEDGKIYVNEINTIPGSLAFYLWEHAGLKFDELLDELIKLALKRARERENLTFSYETNILSNMANGGTKGIKK